jgi:hypothetical protein
MNLDIIKEEFKRLISEKCDYRKTLDYLIQYNSLDKIAAEMLQLWTNLYRTLVITAKSRRTRRFSLRVSVVL